VAEISATDAKNRFGEVLEMARKEPVRIQKNGRDFAVVIAADEYDRMIAATSAPKVNPLVKKLHEESTKRWGKVYEALAK
jgi:prevent-host-death family protein